MHYSSASGKQRLATFFGVVCVIGLLVIAVIAFAPASSATRQAASASSATSTTVKHRRPEFVPGDVLVRFKKNQAFEGSAYLAVPSDSANKQSTDAPQEVVQVQVDRFGGSDLVDGLRVAHTATTDTWKAIAALKARDDVLYAEPNYIVHALNTPNDPGFGFLSGMTKVAAPQAWDTVQGTRNIVVGVVDEGIDISHPDLAANIWTNPSPGSIPGFSGDLHGYDFVNNVGTVPAEVHATHVAGTIGAVGNNGVGVVGVNWQVGLMSLRFIDQVTNNGSEADAIRAYNYAKQMRDLFVSSGGTSGANVRALNASYGGGGFSQAESDALNAIGQSGILFVAAAGNDATNTDINPNYPSGYNLPNVIAVAATDSNDNFATSFSNFGPKSVLMGAPGVGILSTTPKNQNLCTTEPSLTDANGYTYSRCSGTSMSTPHVTGAAALIAAAAAAANRNLTAPQLRGLLAFNGDVVPALQGKTVTGRRLNVFKSLQAFNENDTTPPGTVGSLAVSSQTGRTFNLSWTASGDDGAAGQASLYDISFVDQSTGAVIPLTTILPAASGSPQTLSVNVPYRHTNGTIRLREFDNVGNEGVPATIRVNIDPLIDDPYVATTGAPASLSTGGTGLNLKQDDAFTTYNFLNGFTFPFFGSSFSKVTVSTNGALYFPNSPSHDVPSSVSELSSFKMIAAMWDDMDLRACFRADSDIYVVQPDASRVIFRWQGIPFTADICPASPSTDPNTFVNFEVELQSNGTVITRYGGGNIGVFPVVGISAGEPDAYVINSLTSENNPINLTNATGAVFTPRTGTALPTVSFSTASYTISEGGGSAVITVTRTGDTSGTSSVDYATSDGTAKQSSDYSVTTGTLTWPAGDTTPKTFSVPIVDDVYPEPAETVNLSLSNPVGATLAAQATAVLTITDNDTTSVPSIPQTRFMAALNISQETPPPSLSCPPTCPFPTGTGLVLLNSNQTSALAGLQFANLTAPETVAHIHTGAIGVAGPATFPLPTANPVTNFTFGPTASQVADLKAGNQYMNVHSNNFPNGEIRGQLLWNPTLELNFFVRQQYLDFLSREPDTNGFNFWVGEINCQPHSQGQVPPDQADVQCFHDRTIAVSDAFFFEGEFHQTAGFVFLVYRAAYGNQQPFPNPDPANPTEANKLPEYGVFTTDRARVVGGSSLTAQQQAFTNLLVTRSEFLAKYPTASFPDAHSFVQAILANIQNADPGVTFTAQTQTALETQYTNAGGGNAGRAMVLYSLSLDDAANNPINNRLFVDAEYNRQFALTLYFAYLRRNPDIAGFLFWQSQINKAPVRDGGTQQGLVCSFITSGEYQARFGPFFPRSNQECPQ